MKKIFLLLSLISSLSAQAVDYSSKKSELDQIFERLQNQAKYERRAEGVALFAMAGAAGAMAFNSYNNPGQSSEQWGGIVVGLGSLGWGIERFYEASYTEDEIKTYFDERETSSIHLATKVRRGEELLEHLAEREKQNRLENATITGLASLACFHATSFKTRHNQTHTDVQTGSYFFLLMTAKYLLWPSAAERAFKNYSENQKDSSVQVSFDVTPIYQGTAAQLSFNF